MTQERKVKLALTTIFVARSAGMCIAALVLAPIVWVFWGLAVFLTAPLPDPSFGSSFYLSFATVIALQIINKAGRWAFPRLKDELPKEEK